MPRSRAIALCPAVAACQAADTPSTPWSVRDSAGVEIVENAGNPGAIGSTHRPF